MNGFEDKQKWNKYCKQNGDRQDMCLEQRLVDGQEERNGNPGLEEDLVDPCYAGMMTLGRQLGKIGSQRPRTEMDADNCRKHMSTYGQQMVTREFIRNKKN